MGTLSRSAIVAALFTGAFALHAFEQRTIWFNVPYNVVYPQTTAPTFPPTFAGNQNGDWSTYSAISAAIMGLPTGGNAGILVPTISQLFADLGVPGNLQGSLLSSSLTVDYDLRGEWNLTLTGSFAAPQTATVDANGDLLIGSLQSPALAFGGVPTGPGISTVNLAVSGSGSVSNAVPSTTIILEDTDTQVIPLSGNDLTILGSGTPSFATLPVTWFTQAQNQTTGNYNIQGATFAAIRVGITYTFLPESNWAWAGLPLVFGAWAVRRRMTQATAA